MVQQRIHLILFIHMIHLIHLHFTISIMGLFICLVSSSAQICKVVWNHNLQSIIAGSSLQALAKNKAICLSRITMNNKKLNAMQQSVNALIRFKKRQSKLNKLLGASIHIFLLMGDLKSLRPLTMIILLSVMTLLMKN